VYEDVAAQQRGLQVDSLSLLQRMLRDAQQGPADSGCLDLLGTATPPSN
jgi:hypothetical protein